MVLWYFLFKKREKVGLEYNGRDSAVSMMWRHKKRLDLTVDNTLPTIHTKEKKKASNIRTILFFSNRGDKSSFVHGAQIFSVIRWGTHSHGPITLNPPASAESSAGLFTAVALLICTCLVPLGGIPILNETPRQQII